MTETSANTPRAFAILFRDLNRWDASSFHQIKWHWPRQAMTPIGSVLGVRRERVNKAAFTFSDLQPITIHFDGSVDKRIVDANREYSMDLWFARPGDIVVAKIDLKNGAVGIIPADWKNVVVTGHFVVYKPDLARLIPEYLHRIIQAGFFKAHLWRNKVGAEGRKEVKLNFFEEQEIPLPSIGEQEAMVAHWRKAQDEIAEVRDRAAKLEADLPQRIYRELGTPTPTEDKPVSKCFAMSWKDIDRWSFNYVSRANQGLLGFTKSQFPIEPLGNHLIETMNGYCIKPVPGPTPHKMLKLNALDPGGLDLSASKSVKVSDRIAERFSLRKDDILICRSNAYEYVAKCALVRQNEPAYLFPDIIIRARVKASVIPEFVTEVIQTPLGRSYFQINSRRAVGGMWKISADDILNFPLPVPPLAVQRQIVNLVALARQEIARERETADRLSREINAKIEALILGTTKLSQI